MAQEFRQRLGSVEAVYEARRGLVLRDAHDPLIELTICEADLLDLIGLVCRHNPAAGTVAAAASSPPEGESTAQDLGSERS